MIESMMEEDEVSMKIVKNIADSVEEMIETEVDFLSNRNGKQEKCPFWT